MEQQTEYFVVKIGNTFSEEKVIDGPFRSEDEAFERAEDLNFEVQEIWYSEYPFNPDVGFELMTKEDVKRERPELLRLVNLEMY